MKNRKDLAEASALWVPQVRPCVDEKAKSALWTRIANPQSPEHNTQLQS